MGKSFELFTSGCQWYHNETWRSEMLRKWEKKRKNPAAHFKRNWKRAGERLNLGSDFEKKYLRFLRENICRIKFTLNRKTFPTNCIINSRIFQDSPDLPINLRKLQQNLKTSWRKTSAKSEINHILTQNYIDSSSLIRCWTQFFLNYQELNGNLLPQGLQMHVVCFKFETSSWAI